MSAQPEYLELGVNLIGFLSAKLRDLQGIRSLANELIQNADDAPDATEIKFDFCGDALYVFNNGKFRDIDFKRLSEIASEGKREEEDTSGAFGIGFIAVYQVTDAPEIKSSGLHWTIRPDEKPSHRILQIQIDDEGGTLFRLPWATNPDSKLRKGLRAEPVNIKNIDSWVSELSESLPNAMIFLRKINHITLCRNGQAILNLFKVAEDNQIIIESSNGKVKFWTLFESSFIEKEVELRAKYPQIEKKRSATVKIAISDSVEVEGFICACLPTQMVTGLPIHINADFYPKSDRKNIHLESDYQSEWNRELIICAAKTLAKNLISIRDLLDPILFWNLIENAYKLSIKVKNKENALVFANFWDEIYTELQTKPFVYTGFNDWGYSKNVRLLEKEEEEINREYLEQAGIALVHKGLRPFFSLLTALDVKLLNIRDIIYVLDKSRLDKPISPENLPCWLTRPDSLEKFWNYIAFLYKKRVDREGALIKQLSTYAIAPATDGLLYPSHNVLRTDVQTAELFSPLLITPFLSSKALDHEIFTILCPKLTPERAITLLENLPKKTLIERLNNDPLPLLKWFEQHKTELTDILKTRTSNLPIYPAVKGLFPLNELAFPGGFTDPLGLAELIDINRCKGLVDFLKSLGAQELTFISYIQDHVLIKLNEQYSGLDGNQLRSLVQLLAKEIGVLRDNKNLKIPLSQVSIIECSDGIFRSAKDVYFPLDSIKEILGDQVHYIKSDSSLSLNNFYQWLEISHLPRPNDVKKRLRLITSSPPSVASKKEVESIIKHLGVVQKQGELQKDDWAYLKTMAWLPARANTVQWFHPNQLYTVFRDFLFKTQASFLDIPKDLQTKSADFLREIGIKNEPDVIQVVNHLLYMSNEEQLINKEVYRFLNDNYIDPNISKLIGERCLLLDNKYYRPDQAFWGEHCFGPLRVRLGRDLRIYNNLFDKLQVREIPDHNDAVSVLIEISDEYRPSNKVLSDEIYDIVINCWSILSKAYEEGRIDSDFLESLRYRRVIPNKQRILYSPGCLFFEDRYKSRFEELLKNDLINRIHGVWLAMSAAGVCPLSNMVTVSILEKQHPEEDNYITMLIIERSITLTRCLEGLSGIGDHQIQEKLGRLKQTKFIRVKQLLIQLTIDRPINYSTDPSIELAYYDEKEHILYYYSGNGFIPWTPVARELALSLNIEGDTGRVASGIKEVLSAASPEEADENLNDLGYPMLDSQPPPVTMVKEITELGDVASDIDYDANLKDQFGISEGHPVKKEVATTESITVAEEESITDGDRKDIVDIDSLDQDRLVTTRKNRPQKRSRLRTYVVPDNHDGEKSRSFENSEGIIEIDKAGIKRVMEYEKSQGRIPELMPHSHPGYDIKSYDKQTDEVRYIEVKSISINWNQGDVGMTSNQFKKAQELKDAYWLYVAERPQAEEFKIFPIQNPAEKVTDFLYDGGWQVLSKDIK